MLFIYFLLAFLATLAGAMAGLGGGVIIKPVLDVLGQDNLNTISILSSVTVFSMATVSMIKQFLAGFRFEKRMIYLALGAVVGGIAGKELFSIISSNLDQTILKGTQSAILAILLVFVLLKNKLPDWDIENIFVTCLLGVVLGTTASFLGIGGGPINVVFLYMFLRMNVKDAAVVSILIIFFSQAAKLLMIQIDTGFSVYDNLNKLYYMVPGGILGGLMGSKFNRKLSEEFIERFFNIMIACLICLNFYNAINAFFM